MVNMMKQPTLTGIAWGYNHLSQDYCLDACVAALKALCDEVIVLDAGSTDGSAEVIKGYEDQKTRVVLCGTSEWERQRGREKLSYFQNLAAAFVTTDYYVLSQADEVLHQGSFPQIREAIATGKEAFMITRINLWGSSTTQLNVEQARKPCSTQVIRIAKAGYLSVDDGEGIAANIDNLDFVDAIRLYHMGFVRNKHVMKDKIIHMQERVFEMAGHDQKLDGMDVFNPSAWFGPGDLIPIAEELPIFVQQWAQERDQINSI